MAIALVAQPWWVNFIILIPPLAWFSWRRGGVAVTVRQLAISGVFAAEFCFVETMVVVYLSAATGLLLGFQSTISDLVRMYVQYSVHIQATAQYMKNKIH